LYHFNPRENKIDAYGRVSGEEIIDAPKTTVISRFIAGKRENRIIWDETSTKLRLQEVRQSIFRKICNSIHLRRILKGAGFLL
jgi:hypothetical protein